MYLIRNNKCEKYFVNYPESAIHLSLKNISYNDSFLNPFHLGHALTIVEHLHKCKKI